jgi:hypothetical protein
LAFSSSAIAQGTPPKKPATKPAAAAPATPAPAPTPPPPAATPAAPPPPKPADSAEVEDRHAVYISVEIGVARADLGGIKDNLGFDKTSANGYLAGLGIGYRFKDIRIGARFRDSNTTEFSLRSIMGELGYGLAFRPVAPILFVHAGYMYDTGVERAVIASSLPKGNLLTPSVDMEGFVLGGELGASYVATKFLRIGPFLGVDFTFLHRGQTPLPQSIVPIADETKQKPLFSDSGSGIGYLLSVGLRGTADIGF